MSKTPPSRPEFVADEHLDYLDDLRASGATNMFGARPFLIRRFPRLKGGEAGKVLAYWMDTFPRATDAPVGDVWNESEGQGA